MNWYVLYTKSRNEKKLAALLEEKGINVYCPLQETVKQWSDRKKKIQEPVFRSYIFVALNDYEAEQVEVLRTRGAVRFLWWLGKPGIVREEEITAIKDFLDEYRNAEIKVEVQTGQDVMIKEGPLKDMPGKVMLVKGSKAVLFVKSLGLNLVAHISLNALDPIK